MTQPSSSEISILKTIWRRNDAGSWSGHDLASISLKPRSGYSSDYFKIQDEMNLMTHSPGNIMESFFSSFGMTQFLLRQSIVPIVAWNTGDAELRCIGTGFFISASGLLMTAAHVIRDPVDEKYASTSVRSSGSYELGEDLHFGIMLPANPAMRTAPFRVHPVLREARWFICPFEWVQHWGKEVESPLLHEPPQFKLETDIGIGKVQVFPELGPYQPLNIGPHNLRVEDRAVAIGYAEMRNIRLDGSDDYQPELVVSVGSVTAIHRDNITEKQNPTPGPNFEFSAKIPGKMSGSPILVGGGILTKGVVSRSWQDESHATGCLVASVMHLPLARNKSLLDMISSGEEGIAHMIGAGL